MPYFSVVLSTCNRGVHILPTVRSVLAQTFQDFELLVVGECCTDDTESVLERLLDERVKWLNLAEGGGSQSFPNNAGIEQAASSHIAYLGHDDLWAPDHLEKLAGLLREGIDFAVSGCICHPQPGVRGWLVLGIFDAGDQQAKFEHVFPPSSFAHSRHAIQAIGGWRDTHTIGASVDADLLLRAARAGLTFASTGKVTVHKFVAANRYLYDVRPASHEQAEMLERMGQPGFDETVATIVEASKRAGTYMSLRHPPHEGEIAGGHAFGKGSMRAKLQPLTGAALIRQSSEPRGLDWKLFEPGETRLRWSNLNPRPKILIPYTSRFPVHLRIWVAHQNPEVLKALGIEVEGEAVRLRIEHLHHNGTLWEATATMTVALSQTDYSIAVIILPDAALPGGEMPGIAVAELALDPLQAGAEPPVACEDGEALQVAVSREKALIEHLLAERAAERGQLETEREAVRAERARVEAERLAERAWVQSERTTELGRIEAERAELGRRMAALKASFSWRLTAPFREIHRLARKVTKEVRRTHQKLLRRVR